MMKLKTKLLTLPLIGGTALSAVAQKQQRPNIIVILADDLGYGDVSAYGSTTIKTPNLDRLAQQGAMFTNGYSTSATSTPSRYALMTGMYPWKNPNAKILPGDAPLIISPEQATLPKMMQQAGYTTGAIGKWHLGMGGGNVNWNETVKPGAREIGFNYSNLIAATNDRVPTVYVENGNVVGLDKNDPIEVSYTTNFEGEPTAITHPHLLKMKWSHGHNFSVVNGIGRIGYMRGGKAARWIDEDMADYFVNHVKGFINKNEQKPFFLYYGLHQPHVPRAPHARFVGHSGMGPRGDAIIEADWCVGELLKHLESKGLLENTLIIFSSDNGPILDDGYQDQAIELLGNHKPSGILRGGKYSLFEAGTRVPLMAYWKGTIQPIQSDAIVCQIDLMASLGKLVGSKIPKGLDSRNLLNTFLGKNPKGRNELVIEADQRLAFRKGNYVIIPPYKGPRFNGAHSEVANLPNWTLYNLAEDISQQSDISTQEPKQLKKMKQEFLKLTEGYRTQQIMDVDQP